VDDGATVLLPEKDEEFVDYFADLQNHRLLGKIKNFEYVEGENHAHLERSGRLIPNCVSRPIGAVRIRVGAVLEPRVTVSHRRISANTFARRSTRRSKSNRAMWTRMCIHQFYIEAGPKIRVFAEAAIIPSSLKVLRRIMPYFKVSSIHVQKNGRDLGASDYAERQ